MDDLTENQTFYESLKMKIKEMDNEIKSIDLKINDATQILTNLQSERVRLESLRGHASALLPTQENESEELVSSRNPETGTTGSDPGSLYSAMNAWHATGDLNNRPKVGKIISDAVVKILLTRLAFDSETRPMHYRTLVDEMHNMGINVSGADPGLNLIAHIQKDKRIVRMKRGHYGLTSWLDPNS